MIGVWDNGGAPGVSTILRRAVVLLTLRAGHSWGSEELIASMMRGSLPLIYSSVLTQVHLAFGFEFGEASQELLRI